MDRIFVNAETVTSQVYKRLRSYHEAGLVDPALFAVSLRKGMEDIGIDATDQDLEALLPIQTGKARLPDGCVTVLEVWVRQASSPRAHSSLWGREHTPSPDAETRLFPVYYGSYYGHKHYKQSGPWLQVNEREGILRVVYTGSLTQTDLPDVPNEPVIQDFLVKKLVYEQLHDWYLNSEIANLDRIIQLAAQELADAQTLAAKYEKMPSFNDLVFARRNRPKQFKNPWNRS